MPNAIRIIFPQFISGFATQRANYADGERLPRSNLTFKDKQIGSRMAIVTPSEAPLPVKTGSMTFDAIPFFSGPPTDSLGRANPHPHWLSFAAVCQHLTPRVGFIFCLVIILVARYATSPWRKVPPGPKGLPILGNALQLKDKRWMFEKDCKQNFRMSNSTVAQSCDTTSSPGGSQKILCI